MIRLGTAALVAASLLAAVTSAACSTKPADNTATDTGSVSAGASAPAVDSAATAAPMTDTTHAAATPAAAATTAATTAPAPAAATSPKRAAPAVDSTRKGKATPTPAAPATGKTPSTKPAVTTATTSGASHASTSAPPATSTAATAPASAPAAAASSQGQGGPVKVNRFMSYDAEAKRVNLEVVAAFNSQQGGFNFNGGSNGSQTITVPAGWQVAMHVKNADAIPHSAIIIADQRPLPNAPDSPAIPRAYTSHVNDGLQPQTGADDLSFRASKPGTYLIYCGVPGHGPSGMFIKFVVSESATVPSYQM